VPLVAFVPVQLPAAVHEVALVEDQVTIEILPEVMLVGLAENATVGGVRGGRRPWNTEGPWLKVSHEAGALKLQFSDATNVDGVVSAATAGSDTASKVGAASKGESAITEASALRALALRSEETKTERTCITPHQAAAIHKL